MRISRNDAPDDFVDSRFERRQGNVQEFLVRAIQMHIPFVHFFSRSVKDLKAGSVFSVNRIRTSSGDV